MQSFSNSSEVE